MPQPDDAGGGTSKAKTASATAAPREWQSHSPNQNANPQVRHVSRCEMETLMVVSAYIGNKKGDTVTQESNAFALDSTPEAGLASPNVSINRVTQASPTVNTQSMQDCARTPSVAGGDTSLGEGGTGGGAGCADDRRR